MGKVNRSYSSLSLLRRILLQGRAFWPHTTGIFLLSLLSVPLSLLVPVPLKIIVDSAFGEVPLPAVLTRFFPAGFEFSFANTVIIAVVMLVLIELLIHLHGFISWVLQSYTGEKLVLSFRTLLFNQIQRLSLAYHDKTGVSDSLYRIQYDASSIRTLFVNGISSIITSVITVVGMLYIMTTIDWHFTVIALAIIPFLIVLVRISRSKMKSHWYDVKRQESSAMAVVHEALSALRVVKAFAMEGHEEGRFVKRSQNAFRSQLKAAYTSGIFDLLIGVILATGTALFLYQGSFFVQQGKITLGELILVMTYLAQLFNPLKLIARSLTSFQSAFVGLERAYTLIDKEKDVKEMPGASHVKRVSGGIRFENVSFEYVKGSPVLQHISFEIGPGQKVGIMGSTGSGKTTLINLLIRFYEPTEGRILMDGRDIREYKLADYRSQFSIVLQDPVLFSTTIEENIAYGKPEAGKAEIQQASEAAYASHFINRLPAKFETEVGERGVQLSGGERQRISIARAFLKNAPVLILDEPTSSVDIRTEQMIMDATKKLMEGRTTFLITHRLDILSHCDVIIHLEKGKIIDLVMNDKSGVLEEKISSFRQQAV